MFAFKKFIAAFLLPPGIFVAVLIVSGLLFLKKSRRAGVLCIIVGVAIWLLSIGPVSDALLKGLESGLTIPANPRGDVIVILGGGVYDGAKDLTGIGAPAEDTLDRIVTAVRLQKRLHVPIIVSGGAAFSWRKSEADVDRRFLTDLGVPADKIILDNRSRDTFEEAKYIKKICERHHFKRPILVTSAYHMKRSLMMFRLFNVKVIPVPAGFKTWDRKYGWIDYLPGDPEGSITACHEYLGLLYYKTVGILE